MIFLNDLYYFNTVSDQIRGLYYKASSTHPIYLTRYHTSAYRLVYGTVNEQLDVSNWQHTVHKADKDKPFPPISYR